MPIVKEWAIDARGQYLKDIKNNIWTIFAKGQYLKDTENNMYVGNYIMPKVNISRILKIICWHLLPKVNI